MHEIVLDGESISLEDVNHIANRQARVRIADEAVQRMRKSRETVEYIIQTEETVYGINTGFGKLANVHINIDELEELQYNLVLSHSCGTGDPIPAPIVRIILALKANALCKGYSGTRPELAQFLITLLNHDILPCIPQKGSVGASGDLAPLAHMTLPLLGLGFAYVDEECIPGDRALERAGLKPIRLYPKEGLALLNGTQVMTAYAALAVIRSLRLAKLADVAGAITVESLLGTKRAFDERIHAARGFEHQLLVARNLRKLMEKSDIVESHKDCGKVQDAYSSRCIPQVHGAARQALAYVRQVVETELNAATDNPLVFTDTGEVISGGNFHGMPVSAAADTLSIALCQWAGISERRLENLMDPVQSGLPPFLATHSGTNSGFMIAQVTAAALVSENKVLAHPASVDSIPTSANQEDFVSMGTHAARKALQILENTETVIGIELLAGCQAIDFRTGLEPGLGTGAAHRLIREYISTLQRDRLLHDDIQLVNVMIQENKILEHIEAVIGPL